MCINLRRASQIYVHMHIYVCQRRHQTKNNRTCLIRCYESRWRRFQQMPRWPPVMVFWNRWRQAYFGPGVRSIGDDNGSQSRLRVDDLHSWNGVCCCFCCCLKICIQISRSCSFISVSFCIGCWYSMNRCCSTSGDGTGGQSSATKKHHTTIYHLFLLFPLIFSNYLSDFDFPQ